MISDDQEQPVLKLCGFAVSNYYNKVKIALLEKGICFEEELCMVSQDPAMLERSPMGKVPFLDFGDGRTLSESQVILEFLEDNWPQKPLYPAGPLERARCREMIAHLEQHVEIPARRLYRAAFFGGTVSDEAKEQAEKDIARGVRAFMKLARFSPWTAGAEFSALDCAAAMHLPIVSLATRATYGADAFAAQGDTIKAYLELAGERPSIAKTNADRKAYLEARKKA